MPQPQIRHDVYGTQLAPLVDATREPRGQHGRNPDIRREALRLLDQLLAHVMVRGFYGHVVLQCHVQNGMLQGELRHVTEQVYHCPKDE
jgi:hypothetical protein